MEQGGISAAMLADAFASATSEDGRFYGSMDAQSKTFSGQMSTLEDNVSSLKGQLSEGLTTMLSGTVLPMVNGWLGELSTAFSQNGAKGLIIHIISLQIHQPSPLPCMFTATATARPPIRSAQPTLISTEAVP